MATEIHKTWNEVRSQVNDMVEELSSWRDYEEEVDYFSDSTDDLTNAIEALLVVLAKRT